MLERTLTAREIDLGGLIVGRVLPVATKRSLGPFVFLDHMGPHTLAPGGGFDVRPHPHIGLATLTYLYEGESMHRDSMGVVETVLPGDVNMMIAGGGVVHSERSTEEVRKRGGKMHGLQYWLALPAANEDDAPSFQHAGREELPIFDGPGFTAKVAVGTYHGHASPIVFPSRTLLVDVTLQAGAELALNGEEKELGLYVSEGSVEVDGVVHAPRQLAILDRTPTRVRATAASRVALFGGDPLDGPRTMYWNFVATSSERIERAKQRWLDRGFPAIPGDDEEFIPLPSTHHPF